MQFSMPAYRGALSFDRVMEGRPIAGTSSILFAIPVELLRLIIHYVALDKSDLSSLALVNSDCRQLARSAQFNSLLLDFSPRAIDILAELQKEAVQRLKSPQGLTLSPSLGACVRQLISNTNKYWSQLSSIKPPDEDRDDLRLSQWRTTAGLISDYMNKLYNPTVFLVIPTLPHLDKLSLASCELDDELLDCLTMSTVRDLTIDGSFMKVPNMRVGRRPWHLQALTVHADWNFQFAYERPGRLDSSSFWQAVLGTCHSTLQFLRIEQREFPRRKDMPISFDLEFPNLKALLLGFTTSLDSVALRSLLRANLSILVVNYESAAVRQVLSETNQIPTLKTLIFIGFDFPPSASIRFIEVNPGITSFAITSKQTDAFLRCVIHSFIHHNSLRTLSLKWGGTSIPEDSLNELSLLSQIEVLHISAGFDTGFPHDWFVDHNQLRSCLAPLAKLRRLIITRDTYQLPPDERTWFEAERYYDGRSPKNGGRRWTRHRNQMLEYAAQYVQTFPKLEFIHVGMVLFTVEVVAGTRKPVVEGAAWVGEGGYDVMKKEFGLVV